MPKITLLPKSAFCILALAFCLAACFQIAVVPTASMEGTVLVGDHLFVSSALDGPSLPGTSWRLPRLAAPRRGQIVSFRAPGESGAVYLKRVVALGGDSVEMRDGVLYINDTAMREPYAPRSRYMANVPRQTVPGGEIYVLGDNRNNSEDSRAWGPVPVQSVIGRPILVLWSFRTKSSDWMDSRGEPTNAFYWTALHHLIPLTRWSRTGLLL